MRLRVFSIGGVSHVDVNVKKSLLIGAVNKDQIVVYVDGNIVLIDNELPQRVEEINDKEG
jgi:hypothetical protein